MNNLFALTSRELKAFWYSPIAYAVGAVFMLLQGFVFWLLINALNDPRSDPSWTIGQAFFGGTIFYWFSVLLITPLLTMRTFSEEKRTGTIELLLTAPVTDAEVVLAKFLGAWTTYSLLWAFTLSFFLVLRLLTPFDWGPILIGYLGTWLLGGVLLAVGILASSLTRNQVIAAVLSSVTLILCFCIGFLQVFVNDQETMRLIQYFSLIEHLTDFGKGIIDTRPVIFYLSLTAIALFVTGRVIANPRWRS